MLKKIIICGLILSAVLFAIGEKPKTAESEGASSAVSAPLRPAVPLKQPIEELSAAQLYKRAVEEHQTAQNMNYPEQTERAIAASVLFVQKFPEDERRFELMYFLALDYARNNKLAERKKTIEDFFAQIPVSANATQKELTKLMRLELLPTLVYSAGGAASANALYQELRAEYVSSNAVLAKLYQDALSILDVAGQKVAYSFFREGNNRNYLVNSSNYYIYAYKLAVIYFNENNYQAASPLFEEVAAREEPIYSFFAESAVSYLKQINSEK